MTTWTVYHSDKFVSSMLFAEKVFARINVWSSTKTYRSKVKTTNTLHSDPGGPCGDGKKQQFDLTQRGKFDCSENEQVR